MGYSWEIFSPLKTQVDEIRIGSGRNDQVILQLPLVAVVDEIDAGIKLFELHFGISCDIGPPFLWIIANHVIDLD